ncbi:MAG: hypothetical protein H7A18_07315 [Sinobacteraceae bacterium]|nr:hypothetical protein [Nevskiaceae bacterium]MCP5339519.1 hypothetical protein [Nevskiaceae bacterium]MCP5359189.1 hypothetical protein [Nevskiaceae bacterium]MCP5466423.1 hypothetical protein [Nevskiaceae bacterium]MCP5471876.1 hypothetical protein [Nevskiaceae bacterium]
MVHRHGVAEIVGCCLPYLWLKRGGSVWQLLPAARSLALLGMGILAWGGWRV